MYSQLSPGKAKKKHLHELLQHPHAMKSVMQCFIQEQSRNLKDVIKRSNDKIRNSRGRKHRII
jgi:hypothetical protein